MAEYTTEPTIVYFLKRTTMAFVEVMALTVILGFVVLALLDLDDKRYDHVAE